MVTVRAEPEFSPAAIRRERKARRLSQPAVARAAGVSQPYLSQIELGRRGASHETLLHIAGAIGCAVEDFAPRRRKRDGVRA